MAPPARVEPLPVGDGEQRPVGHPGGGSRGHSVGMGAPGAVVASLEESAGVRPGRVAVIDRRQGRFAHGGHHRDEEPAGGHAEVGAGGDDRGCVGQLRPSPGVLPDPGEGDPREAFGEVSARYPATEPGNAVVVTVRDPPGRHPVPPAVAGAVTMSSTARAGTTRTAVPAAPRARTALNTSSRRASPAVSPRARRRWRWLEGCPRRPRFTSPTSPRAEPWPAPTSRRGTRAGITAHLWGARLPTRARRPAA